MARRAAQSLYAGGQYRDAHAAIDWLGKAFGFEPLMVHAGDGPAVVAHAELRLGDAIVMVGSAGGSMGHILSPGGKPQIQSLYVVIDNPDEHYARAKAAGAEMLIDLHDTDYGSRGYTCRDIEGHVWSFGTYRPEIPD